MGTENAKSHSLQRNITERLKEPTPGMDQSAKDTGNMRASKR